MSKLDVFDAIGADLDRERSRKRRHFAPALGLAILLIAFVLGAIGVRHDLMLQPAWRVATHVGLWVICLLLFPAIGVGLWFPSRLTRIIVALVGICFATASAFGWPPASPADGSGAPCAIMLFSVGALFLGLGAISGAFGQRRAASSTFWVASGVSLGALACVTWICPKDAVNHVTMSHLLPTAGLAIAAALVGLRFHQRYRRTP